MIKRAQTAIEFVALVAFILFFFVIFFLTIQENLSDRLREKRTLAIRELALNVQNELNLALQTSDGYYREFKIPDKISNLDYEINITQGTVYIITKDKKNAIALPVANVTGDVIKGTNIIKKENGEIKLNL
jgi:hypothetical protein